MKLDDYIHMKYDDLGIFFENLTGLLCWKDTSSIFKIANNTALLDKHFH